MRTVQTREARSLTARCNTWAPWLITRLFQRILTGSYENTRQLSRLVRKEAFHPHRQPTLVAENRQPGTWAQSRAIEQPRTMTLQSLRARPIAEKPMQSRGKLAKRRRKHSKPSDSGFGRCFVVPFHNVRVAVENAFGPVRSPKATSYKKNIGWQLYPTSCLMLSVSPKTQGGVRKTWSFAACVPCKLACGVSFRIASGERPHPHDTHDTLCYSLTPPHIQPCMPIPQNALVFLMSRRISSRTFLQCQR